jgi:hypothetical protein
VWQKWDSTTIKIETIFATTASTATTLPGLVKPSVKVPAIDNIKSSKKKCR